MKVVGVMPAYFEEARIADVIRAAQPFLDLLVVVDDGSTDGTATAAELPGVVVLRHRMNRGQGAALRTGTLAAQQLGADILVHLDADGQHDAADIPRLIAPIQDGVADVVFGSRFLEFSPQGMPRMRRVLLWAARWFNAFALGIPKTVTDPQSGFRAIHAAALDKIPFRQDRMAHASEILRLVTRSDLRWREVPAHVIYSEQHLQKGQKNSDALKIVWQLLLGVFTR